MISPPSYSEQPRLLRAEKLANYRHTSSFPLLLTWALDTIPPVAFRGVAALFVVTIQDTPNLNRHFH